MTFHTYTLGERQVQHTTDLKKAECLCLSSCPFFRGQALRCGHPVPFAFQCASPLFCRVVVVGSAPIRLASADDALCHGGKRRVSLASFLNTDRWQEEVHKPHMALRQKTELKTTLLRRMTCKHGDKYRKRLFVCLSFLPMFLPLKTVLPC